jgi:hypothetical protein
MPTDVQNQGYAPLEPGDPPQTRRYGEGQELHLQVPSSLNATTIFDRWELNGQFYSNQTLIALSMSAASDNGTLVPVYVVTP